MGLSRLTKKGRRSAEKNPKGPRASTMPRLTFVGRLSMASQGLQSDLPNATCTHDIRIKGLISWVRSDQESVSDRESP